MSSPRTPHPRPVEFAAPPIPTTPLQMQYLNALSPSLALGMGVDPISGVTGQHLITTIPTAPTSLTGGAQSINTTTFWMTESAESFANQINVDATAAGNTQAINASFSGSFFKSLSVSANNVMLSATGMWIGGGWTPGDATDYSWDVGAVSTDTVTAEIANLGYTGFINQYGSHFIGGILYGAQYNVCLNVAFENEAYQNAAQAELSAAFASSSASAGISGSVTATAAAQAGFASQAWSQTALGGYTPLPANTLENINENLTSYSNVSPDPILYLLYDWRIIPAIATAAASTTPSFNFNDYLTNLEAVQSTVAQLQYVAATCLNMLNIVNYFGDTNQGYITTSQAAASAALATIKNYTPSDVASFDAATFQPQIGVLGQLAQISNGLINVVLTVTLDSAFSPSSYPTGLYAFIGPVNGPLGYTPSHVGNESWLFGFLSTAFATIQPVQGMLDSNGELDPDWCQYGASITPNSASTTEGIAGVGEDNSSHYPWLTTTVSFI